MKVVGLDLGGTKIAAGVFDGKRLLSKVVVPTPKEGGERVAEALAEAAERAEREAGVRGEAIGLGTPGPLDFRRGVIRFAPNIPGVQDFPIRRILEEATGRPVFLENDANAAALAEHHLGAAQGEESSLYLTVSTGIGGGVVVLGGGVALNAPEGYWEALLEAYRRYLQGWEAPPLRRARLGAEAGLLGAALTAYLEVKDGSG